ncbi:hypothetical protein N9R79_03430 [Vibrio sp.]|nr:hypothetical protein [Vibrio sp.]
MNTKINPIFSCFTLISTLLLTACDNNSGALSNTEEEQRTQQNDGMVSTNEDKDEGRDIITPPQDSPVDESSDEPINSDNEEPSSDNPTLDAPELEPEQPIVALPSHPIEPEEPNLDYPVLDAPESKPRPEHPIVALPSHPELPTIPVVDYPTLAIPEHPIVSGGTKQLTALSGYLVNAQVYQAQCDDVDTLQDTHVTTYKHGQFTVPDDATNLCLHAISGRTVDTDKGVITSDFILKSNEHYSVISPFTSLVVDAMNHGLTHLDAQHYVVDTIKLDIPEDALFGDFIAQAPEQIEVTKLAEYITTMYSLTPLPFKAQMSAIELISSDLRGRLDNGYDISSYEAEVSFSNNTLSVLRQTVNDLDYHSYITESSLGEISIHNVTYINTSEIEEEFINIDLYGQHTSVVGTKLLDSDNSYHFDYTKVDEYGKTTTGTETFIDNLDNTVLSRRYKVANNRYVSETITQEQSIYTNGYQITTTDLTVPDYGRALTTETIESGAGTIRKTITPAGGEAELHVMDTRNNIDTISYGTYPNTRTAIWTEYTARQNQFIEVAKSLPSTLAPHGPAQACRIPKTTDDSYCQRTFIPYLFLNNEVLFHWDNALPDSIAQDVEYPFSFTITWDESLSDLSAIDVDIDRPAHFILSQLDKSCSRGQCRFSSTLIATEDAGGYIRIQALDELSTLLTTQKNKVDVFYQYPTENIVFDDINQTVVGNGYSARYISFINKPIDKMGFGFIIDDTYSTLLNPISNYPTNIISGANGSTTLMLTLSDANGALATDNNGTPLIIELNVSSSNSCYWKIMNSYASCYGHHGKKLRYTISSAQWAEIPSGDYQANLVFSLEDLYGSTIGNVNTALTLLKQ